MVEVIPKQHPTISSLWLFAGLCGYGHKGSNNSPAFREEALAQVDDFSKSIPSSLRSREDSYYLRNIMARLSGKPADREFKRLWESMPEELSRNIFLREQKLIRDRYLSPQMEEDLQRKTKEFLLLVQSCLSSPCPKVFLHINLLEKYQRGYNCTINSSLFLIISLYDNQGISWPALRHELYHVVIRQVPKLMNLSFPSALPVSSLYKGSSLQEKKEEYLVRALNILYLEKNKSVPRNISITGEEKQGFRAMKNAVQMVERFLRNRGSR